VSLCVITDREHWLLYASQEPTSTRFGGFASTVRSVMASPMKEVNKMAANEILASQLALDRR
jgi:hypothetical protein